MDRTHVNLIMMAHGHAPVIILPARVGGRHTRDFRQKTIPDRRKFDQPMESGYIDFKYGQFLHPGI